jgi:glyoxylase-like metal-dependent hydrolase (beta-lactamase superfamily II)
VDRRNFLKSAVAGAFTTWACPRGLNGQPAAGGIRRLTENLVVLDGGDSNVLAFSTPSSKPSSKDAGLVLVDSGAPNSGDRVMAALKNLGWNSKVQVLFNTHYHIDQTGNNEIFGAAGAKIIAHEHTRQWMATDYWVSDEDRYEKARPKAAQPTETFQTAGSLQTGSGAADAEQIDYGHLLLAHTDGDMYVFFKTSNVLAVGDVASPLLDPALDYFTGAWIGGRLDAMDMILRLSNEQTRIVPADGPVMTRAEFNSERDMMEEVRSRMWKQVLQGDGPMDMLEGGVLKGLARTWKDPYKFLYDAAKGMWAHHNKLDPSVV